MTVPDPIEVGTGMAYVQGERHPVARRRHYLL